MTFNKFFSMRFFKKILFFAVFFSLCFNISAISYAYANNIDTSVAQFKAYTQDFKQQKFSSSEAILFWVFLKTHATDLARYADHSKKIPPNFQFNEECLGAIRALGYLNEHLFDWHNMWSTTNENDRIRLFMLNEDLGMMQYELGLLP